VRLGGAAARSNYSPETCRCPGQHRHFILAAASIHFERRARGPTTPGEIDGATQFSGSSARCGQFRALAFPSSVPCRSRCHALAGLARARTSDDIRPRAPCTPPRKSFARPPRPLVPGPRMSRASRCGQRRFAPGIHFVANSDLCATGYMRLREWMGEGRAPSARVSKGRTETRRELNVTPDCGEPAGGPRVILVVRSRPDRTYGTATYRRPRRCSQVAAAR
jgi:hypothetical protein